MHYQALAAAIVADGSVQTSGATPAATLNAIIAVDVKRKGKGSVFITHPARRVRAAGAARVLGSGHVCAHTHAYRLGCWGRQAF